MLAEGEPSDNDALRDWKTWGSVVTGVLAGSLALLAAAGNGFVVLAVLRVRRLQRASNVLVCSLAVSDLSVALLVMPAAATKELQGNWVLGETWCVTYLVGDVTLCSASILHLCAIAADRYLCITRPLRMGLGRTARAVLLAAAAWLLALVVSVPLALCTHTRPTASCHYAPPTACHLYAVGASFVVPAGVMLVIYANVLATVRRVKSAAVQTALKPADLRVKVM